MVLAAVLLLLPAGNITSHAAGQPMTTPSLHEDEDTFAVRQALTDEETLPGAQAPADPDVLSGKELISNTLPSHAPDETAGRTPAQLFPVNPEDEDDENLIRRIRFVGNDHVNNSTLESIIRTETNREVLNIPGATLWLGIYRLTGGRYGEEPSILDRTVVAEDMERIINYYESQGFRHVDVDTTVVEYNPNRYEVSFLIEEGRRTYIGEVIYSGMPQLDDEEELQAFFENSELSVDAANDTTYLSGMHFTYEKMTDERRRIIDFLRNRGYAAVQRDSVSTIVRENHQVSPYEVDVLFRVNPGRVYNFGDLHLSLLGPAGDNPANMRHDTLSGMPYTVDPYRIFMSVDPESHTRFQLLQDMVRFRPGERYNHELYMRTVNRFQNLDMLAVRRFGLGEEDSQPNYDSSHLPVRINMQSMPRHQIQTDLFGMQRIGFGAGAGARYSNNNLFGRAERLELGLQGSFEYVQDERQLMRSFEASAEYIMPRLNFPFAWMEDRFVFDATRTRYSLTGAQVNQQTFDINANLRFNQQFEFVHSSRSHSLLDFIEFDWLDASATPEFERSIRERFEDIQSERILEDFNPQFSSTVRYTYRHANTDLIQRDDGTVTEATFSIGGNLPYLMDRFIFDPGDVDGGIPSVSLSDLTLSDRQLTYSQFFKTSFDHRSYHPVLEDGVFAWRGFAGFAHPYGETPFIPLNRRFFAGGSNDIRGWSSLRLGPGSLQPGEVPFNGGELKIAGFMEYRHIFARQFLSTNWGVALFTDFGNIWYGPRQEFSDGRFSFDRFYNEIAVGSGYGLRLDWEYVVFRIDLAYRIHDISHSPGERWFNFDGSFLHFGIGHSF